MMLAASSDIAGGQPLARLLAAASAKSAAPCIRPTYGCVETGGCKRPEAEVGLVLIEDFGTAAALRNLPQGQFSYLGLGICLIYPIERYAMEMYMRIEQGTRGG